MSQTILIIDDNITNLKVAVDYLEAYSYKILTASNGQKGVERAILTQPDLILLDVMMPGIDGFETCERLKANEATADIPVIFMTALADSADKVRGFKSGGVDYITKPLDAAEVVNRVRTHLTLRDLQTKLEGRVKERTAELEAEITQRRQVEEEKEQLFVIVRQQSEQLQALTEQILQNQQQQNADIALALREIINKNIEVGSDSLNQARQILANFKAEQTTIRLLDQKLEQTSTIFDHIRQQTQRLAKDVGDHPPSIQAVMRDTPLLQLSTREYEVFQLIIAGKSSTTISSIIGVTRSSVSTYRKRIMTKLGVSDLPSLLKFAVDHRLYQ